MTALYAHPADEHQRLREALPWLVNGTLPELEAQSLRAHLSACADCRREYEFEQTIARGVAAAPAVDYAPQASFAKLMRKVDSAPVRALGWLHRQRRQPLTFALSAQAAAVAALAIALSWLALAPPSAPTADYRTLSATPATELAVPHLQVVFKDSATVTEMHEVLARVHGRVISTGAAAQAGVYRVAFDDTTTDLEQVAQALRADPGVRFVSVQRAAQP